MLAEPWTNTTQLAHLSSPPKRKLMLSASAFGPQMRNRNGGGSSQSWAPKMDGIYGKIHRKMDDAWGYPHFRKPPNCEVDAKIRLGDLTGANLGDITD